MIRSARVLLVLTILSGCAAEQQRVEDDDGGWRSETGYASAMLYRLREINALQSSESEGRKPVDTRAWATALRQTVWEFNVESANMCARGLYTKRSCLPALDPPWLTETQDTSPTEKELERRADWIFAHVQRLWDGVCEDFKTSHPDPGVYMGYCSIE